MDKTRHRQRKYVFLAIFSLLAIIHLIGLMYLLNECTADLYATQGEGLHYESIFVPLMTIIPIPSIFAMVGVIIFCVRKNIEWILRLLEKVFFVQTVLFLSVPVLLAALENELNGGVLIGSGLCVFISAAFTVFVSILKQVVCRDACVDA